MKLLGQENGFSDSRIQLFISNGMISSAVRLAILAASVLLNPQFIGPFAPFFAITLLQAKTRLRERWFPGKRGGSVVADALRSLPDDYVLLNDLTLPDGKSNVDHLVIGPNGLFAIETKNYAGDVKCEGYEWYVDRRRIQSLSRQAKNNAIAVRNGLATLTSDGGGKNPFVIGVLVFTNPTATLKLHQPAVPVLRLEELVDFIRNYKPANHGHVPPSVEERRAVADHLRSLQSKSDAARVTPFRLRLLSFRFHLS